MKSAKLAAVASFIIGAGVGAGSAWYFLKTVYEQRTQEEIDSVKAYYAGKMDELEKKETDISEETPSDEKTDITEYADIIKTEGYQKTDYNAISKANNLEEALAEAVEDGAEEESDDEPEIELVKEAVLEPGEKPYVITPEEYGEFDDYNEISLTHYSDGVLTDMQGNVIDDVDELVGSDYEEHFGEYEDDSVHVRNDAKRCDYEILYDSRKWTDILKSKPYLKED